MEANTTALIAVMVPLDDLANWRPDLERRVFDLSDAVSALQQTRPHHRRGRTWVAAHVSTTTTRNATHGAAIGVASTSQGSEYHGGFNLSRGPAAMSFQTSPPLPTNGENPNMWKTMCEQYFTMFGIHKSF